MYDSYRLFEDDYNNNRKLGETSVNSRDRSLIWKKVLQLQSNNRTDILMKPTLESFKLIQEVLTQPIAAIEYSHLYTISTIS